MALIGGVAAMALLLGVGVVQAQAPDVILDGNSVIRIEDLRVFDEQSELIAIYDVDFKFDTALGVYGPGLDFDFTNETDALTALEAVLEALNVADPMPVQVGPSANSDDQFFIGATTEDTSVRAVGSEYVDFAGAGAWDVFVAVLPPDARFVYADFTVIPEPGSALLLGVGLAALAVVARGRGRTSRDAS